ncbi:MAG: hypothetical protein KatS3mg109_0384 [Pirellulaceae bacterium]|nr:MAG: hypothetical protein KatS3mg109_0384 [Pirellulaceae bacterium]
MAEPLELEALIRALQQAATQPDVDVPGLTAREIADRLSWPEARVDKLLGQLHREGRLIAHRVRRIARDGVYRTHVVYSVKVEKRAK